MAEVRDFLMPDLGEGLTEGEILEWLVQVGDQVNVDQPVVEVSTEKAVVQVPTPFAGKVATLHAQAGEMLAVGKPLISIEVAAGAQASEEASQPGEQSSGSGNVLVGYGTNEPGVTRRRRVTGAASGGASLPGAAVTGASPLVRRLAAELGVDLSTVRGTGPGGIVTRADLEGVAGQPSPTSQAAPSAAQDGTTREKLTGIHRVAAERLTRSYREAPMATAWLTADATRVLQVRERLNADDGRRVTPFALLLKLTVTALRDHPRLNSHFDADSNEVVLFEPVHLGVAVQTDRGLVVPVIRDAHQKSAMEIAAALDKLAAAARDASIDASSLSGSTFTVTNIGAFGVNGGTAIINPPEAAILAVGQIAQRPWVVDGEVVPRSTVEVSLMFDHRVADGGLAGGFIRRLGDLIEDPDRALEQ
ncbi:MAG TPA: dihydrolipoamide acetyltransferase family protein [Candidatus Dormibacteraeota bacterium]|nr:dihydrolipoamide acetyltransferase family protein [Candidatus Dormibacteraeota bacterium]